MTKHFFLALCLSLLGSVFSALDGESARALPDGGVSDVYHHTVIFTGLSLLAGHQKQDHYW